MGRTKTQTLIDRFTEYEKLEIQLFMKWLQTEGFVKTSTENSDKKYNKVVIDFFTNRENDTGRRALDIINRCICINSDGKQCSQPKTSNIHGPDDKGIEKRYNPNYCDIHNRKPSEINQRIHICIGKKSDSSTCDKPAKKEINDNWYCGTHFNKMNRVKN